MTKKLYIFLMFVVVAVLTAFGISTWLEPETEEPVVEEVEILSLTIVDISGMEDSITISFEKGMTWREWVNSDYNDLGFELQDSELYNGEVYINGYCIYQRNTTGDSYISDKVIDVNLEYAYGC